MKNRSFTISIFVLLCLALIASFTLNLRLLYKSEYVLNDLETRVDNLTQERGTDWMDANGTPDSIYFVSFGGDTTWYIKAKQER